jgi:hypothetical protein
MASASIIPRSLPSSAPSQDFEVTVSDSSFTTEPRFETKTIEKATTDGGKYSGQPEPGAANEAATS